MKRWIAAVLLPLLVLTACACGGAENKETEYYEVGEIVEYAPFGEKAAVLLYVDSCNFAVLGRLRQMERFYN